MNEQDARLVVQCGNCGHVNKQTYRFITGRMHWICEKCKTINGATVGETEERMVQEAQEANR